VRLLPLLVLPLVVLGLSGCVDSAGPLVLQASDKLCADSASTTDAVFELYVKDAGPHPIAITSATFGASTKVSVTGVWLVGNDATSGVSIATFPLTSAEWAKRQSIPGATLAGNTESNLAVHLTLASGATAGQAADLTIKYTDADRQHYVASSAAVIGFGPGGACG
jgi:hypothetical protein